MKKRGSIMLIIIFSLAALSIIMTSIMQSITFFHDVALSHVQLEKRYRSLEAALLYVVCAAKNNYDAFFADNNLDQTFYYSISNWPIDSNFFVPLKVSIQVTNNLLITIQTPEHSQQPAAKASCRLVKNENVCSIEDWKTQFY